MFLLSPEHTAFPLFCKGNETFIKNTSVSNMHVAYIPIPGDMK